MNNFKLNTMNRISIIFITFFTFLSCKAQIIPLLEDDGNCISGAYYKDVGNDLNKFEGTWKWEQDGKILTFVFEKKEELISSISGSSFDLLIGEYKYIIDEEVIVDYLSRLQDQTIIGDSHYISGNILLLKNDSPKCNECNNFERRVYLSFHDPERPYLSVNLV
jgi:hypothetical protein